MSRVLSSGGSDRPGTSQLAEPLAWLSERAHENLGTETALRAVALDPDLDEWRVALAGRAGGLTGVAVWASVTITREHDLLVMACRTAPTGGGGRWATRSDRQSLERYQAAYNEERGTTTAPNWDALLGRPAVAVLERSGRIVAVVKRTADTVRYATIGGTWTDPEYRRQGFAARLTAFISAAVLAERPAVQLIVDDDNKAAIALYRSLGFEPAGCCYMAYLSSGE